MALETNARIPSPYVYKPVDFGGKIDAEAANKAAALKAGIQAKKDLKTKNDAALAVKPTWTTEGVLNGAIENKANQIRDTYSKMAAAGIPIWDATTPEGSAFAEEIAGLNKFSNEMKGYEQNINEIEAVKGADNDAYNFYVKQIGEAKDPAAVDAIVTSYRENKDLLAKAPDLPKAVAATVNATAKNKDIVDIGKLNKFDKITIKSSIPDEKVQDVFEVAKNSEASKLEEKLYDFKQKNGILDPEFDKFNSYDEYLMDQVKDQIALTASENDQLRSQWQINISNNAGGTKTTGGGNPIYVRPGDANKQFQALDRTKQLDKGNTKYLAISVDPSVLSNLQQSADMILDEGGARYVKLDELWQFPDKESKGAVQDISWVWTDKAKAQQGAWSPKEGNYKTPSGLDVNGKPVEVLWDQDGNAWATIETTKGDKVRVLIYDTEENVFGVGSPATNSIKGNAQAFLGTFTDAGALKPGVLNNTRASIANIFDKTEGLIPGEVE
jgi:hypothetical protein